ncbi:YesN/AraC family two-component response regulator [Paenibacillus rhizosphaerae]|uniref:YesN/AraC family two-component response regulator n=1 Tax=Paenibacillus rhizosphaerae TaxID=297318 RepID=A0A839TSU9_9BACL|nr:response regulator [Paenibacillus rhizosphaerae]MBB3130154.1 YesN/AraC family two-component response regulator [Paenibacillus rhizosphaerae]
MIKLMVVDDEHWIREGLKRTIDWSSHGIQFIGDAEDGCKALELIEAHVPEMIISDIKMPTMDGMDLLEEIKKRGYDTKVIFISGFSDFAYAQKAVKLGAFDYILKPVEEPILLEIIERCISEIKQKQELNSRLQELAVRIRESLPLARQKHLEMCLTRSLTEREMKSAWEALHINLDPKRLIVMTMVVHEWGGREMDESGCSLMRYALGNLVEEVLSQKGIRCSACPLQGNDFADVALIASLSEQEASSGVEDLYRHMDSVIKDALQVLDVRISIGISGLRERTQLASSFREALTTSMNYLIHGPGQVHTAPMDGRSAGRGSISRATEQLDYRMAACMGQWAADVLLTDHKADFLDSALSNRILHAMKLMDAGRLSELLDVQTGLLQELIKQTPAIAVRYEMNMHISILLSKWQELLQAKDHSKVSAITHQRKLQLYRCSIGDWKTMIMDTFLMKDTDAPSIAHKRTIETALRYIHDNYHLGISLHNVAEKIYMNPSYFSRVFHEEVGETLSRYLIRIRITKAKELLEQTPLKVYEVADRVGYRDFRHFVKTFKEWEGMTPAQYRNYGA